MVEKSNLEIMLGHILAALNEMTEVDNEVNLESAKELCKELLDEATHLRSYVASNN